MTLAQLADILMGNKTKSGPSITVDVASFKEFSRLDVERLIVKLILQEVLSENIVQTAYKSISYLAEGMHVLSLHQLLVKPFAVSFSVCVQKWTNFELLVILVGR